METPVTDFSAMPKEKSGFNEWNKKDAFLNLCEKNAATFQEAMHDHKCHKAGAFYSESFAFLMFCKLYDIDVILESGMGRGTSTEIWARNFSGPIVTCEINRKPHHEEVETRMSKYKNVEVNFGNSSSILDNAAKKYKNKKVALFIDGPKDMGAVDLALKLFKHDNIAFVGIHDVTNPVTKIRDNYGFMSKFEDHLLSTDEPEFREKFSYLDNSMIVTLYDESGNYYDSPEYTEHMMKRFPLGCGIGIAINKKYSFNTEIQ